MISFHALRESPIEGGSLRAEHGRLLNEAAVHQACQHDKANRNPEYYGDIFLSKVVMHVPLTTLAIWLALRSALDSHLPVSMLLLVVGFVSLTHPPA